MTAKKAKDVNLTPDEVERKERKAQEGLPVEKPIEDKIEAKEVMMVEEVVESIKDDKEVEEQLEKNGDEPKTEKAEEEKKPSEDKEAEKEKGSERREDRRRGRDDRRGGRRYREEVDPLLEWKPKTELGKEVMAGKVTSIDAVLDSGKKILEPEIVDKLVPDIQSELLLIGGRKGKGGGIMRIPVRITATMSRSGRKFKSNAFAAVGDEKGLIGLGRASAKESRSAINKAVNKAKTNVIRIKRGCGSWECGCGEEHSIPYKTEGKVGSVRVVLMPAPRGLGLAADDASKKVLKLAGIKDVWMKTYGNTKTRINLIYALFDALKKLYVYDR